MESKCPQVSEKSIRIDHIKQRMNDTSFSCDLPVHYMIPNEPEMVKGKTFFVNPNILLYNSENGRLNCHNESKSVLLFSDDTQENQEKCHELLESYASELKESIESDGRITDALIITKDGIVIEGNRRLWSFREIIASSTSSKLKVAKGIPVHVVDSDNPEDFKAVEAFFSMRKNTKVDWTQEAQAIECFNVDKMYKGYDNFAKSQKLGENIISPSDFEEMKNWGELLLDFRDYRRKYDDKFDIEKANIFYSIKVIHQRLKKYSNAIKCETNRLLLKKYYFGVLNNHLKDGRDEAIYKVLSNEFSDDVKDMHENVLSYRKKLGMSDLDIEKKSSTSFADTLVDIEEEAIDASEPVFITRDLTYEETKEIVREDKKLRSIRDVTAGKSTLLNSVKKVVKEITKLKKIFHGVSPSSSSENFAEILKELDGGIFNLQECKNRCK